MSVATPMGYDRTLPSYGKPPMKSLDATGGGIAQNPWPSSGALASKVKGTKAKLHGNTGTLKNPSTSSWKVMEKASTQIW